ncbi:Retrovirus-related Pol polyprotein from transposon RE2 [Sesamum angolense]|uniref:Retrovirus-related Pol polyprotein from transposon RE2 n=1 Tax=Sesamum angolense TaxID=2727404 RepID=A0AAE1WQH3_9LAMI|nr:Retrovirus-related Pol polyprotein from transposon RE2 [Sesamum angolense]
MTWLLNSMEESVSANVMFLNTAKAMWDALHDMYSHEKNISRVFELYERLFSLKQDDSQSSVEDFLVAKFLSGLDNSLKVVRDHLLASDSVPTLSNALSRVLRVATGSSDSISSSAPTTESSAMAVRGRARPSSRGRGGRGRASNTPTNSRYCTHCGRTNHVVDKCWIKHGKPDWANTVTSGGDTAALEPSPHPSESVTLSREEYEQLLHRPVANSATPPTSSSPDAFAALHGKSWMLDSGATTHLTGNRSTFSNLTLSHKFPPIRLADGSYSPISGSGTIHPTNHLTLTNVLFAPEFPVNLLSISQLTQQHNCSVTFFPSYCVFQDLQTRRTIGGGHERGGLYFLNTSPPIEARALSASVSLFNGIFALAIRPFLHYRKTTYRPLQVYSRRKRSTNTTLAALPDLPPTAAPGHLSVTPTDDLPIALRKGKRSCTAHPLAHSLSFHHLSPIKIFVSSVSIPNTYLEALRHPAWKMAMDDEMSALISRGTWELVEVTPDTDIVACRWVFTLKFRADGTLDRYKARLVAKGFTQTYGVDYFETFSPVARLNSIRVLFSLAVNLNWTMYQMDIKNAFLYGDLNGTVYMEQPPGYVAQGEKQRMVCKLKKAIYGLKQSPRAWFDKFSRIIGEFGFSRCQADHSVFVQTTTSGMVVLAVYVDDILITGSDLVGIEEAKKYLQKHFVTKDLGRPRYFLGIEIAHSKHGISLSQRKYACDLLHEVGLLGTKPVDTPMDSNPNFWNDDGNYLEDKTKYRRLVGKLIYLTVTRPDISFAVRLVSQFMDKPRSVHWEAALRILKYIKASPGKGLLFKRHGHVKIEAFSDADYAGAKDDRKSTSGYCTYVGGNLVTWRSKKQTTVARSSAEAEYRAMAHTTSEILWLKNLLKELGFMYDDPVPMHCDNQAAIHIASNPIFHERTKHIEVDCHFVREAVMSQKICTPFTPSSEQRADIFTKALGGKPFDVLCNKLGMIDIFAPA